MENQQQCSGEKPTLSLIRFGLREASWTEEELPEDWRKRKPFLQNLGEMVRDIEQNPTAGLGKGLKQLEQKLKQGGGETKIGPFVIYKAAPEFFLLQEIQKAS